MVERPLDLQLKDHMHLVPGLILIVILIGLFSGSYPALFMSSLRPVHVLKGKIGSKKSSQKIQQWLIVGQYAVSIAMIICSLVVYSQFQFIQHKELGFDKDHVITIMSDDNSIGKHYATIKNDWLSNPNIIAVTTSSNLPSDINSSTLISKKTDGNPEYNFPIYRLRADYDVLDVFGIELITGRKYSFEFSTDINEADLINETAAKAMGWTAQQAIGKNFKDGNEVVSTIIGVVKDFHMHTMHMPIEPLMIKLKEYNRFISVKVRPEDLNTTIAYLEKTMKQYSPYPFEYQFLDDHFDQLYKEDLRQGEVFGFFTVLTILIASLGLFGLAAFSTHQRIKEIGIRKVLGASIQNIVSLFARNLLKMVMLGFVIAVPIAWYAMHQWLQDFAYRISIQWWMFAMAGLMAVIIAFLTISSQSIKAALTNPVHCLRDE